MVEGIGELTDEIAAYAAIEEFLDARYGRGGGELCVDFYVAVFILQERKFVG